MAHILVVDDDPYVLKSIAWALEGAGYRVTPAQGSRHALSLLGEEVPDLVLSDLQMPYMDGLTLFREVRRRWPGMPFVAMSGRLNPPKDQGLDGFIPKPCNIECLMATVERVLNREKKDPPEPETPEGLKQKQTMQ